jgi:hypothetical protein
MTPGQYIYRPRIGRDLCPGKIAYQWCLSELKYERVVKRMVKRMVITMKIKASTRCYKV